MNRIRAAFLLATLAVVGLLAQNVGTTGQQGTPVHAAKMPVADTKPVEYLRPSVQGPSWLKHLGLTVSQTHMGQMGGTLPPSTRIPSGAPSLNSAIQRFLSTFRSNPEQASEALNEKFLVTGTDLYRWNCQGCHGADGKGSDPEINSVLGPVQGTSPALTKKRMEARGIDPDDDMVKQVSELAETSLRDRLQHGGKSMPSFEYLRPDEVEALMGYMEKLAAVPPTKRDGMVVLESAARVGEHIVRGTCHICHDAAGPGSGHVALSKGRIPSLASIPREQSLSGIIHQVQYGSSSMMKITGGEVMPAYPYFTEEEISAVYLVAYPAPP